MSLYSVYNRFVFLVLLGKLNSELDVCTVVLMVYRLTDIMKETGTLRKLHICSDFCGYKTGYVGYLKRVIKHILSVTCTVLKTSEKLYKLRMDAVYACVKHCTLTRLLDCLFNLTSALLNSFLDTCRVNTSVLNKTLKSKSCNLSAYRIKAGNGDCLRCVVDDKVNTCYSFNSADISALTSYDSALHLIIRERNNRNGRLCSMVSRTTLDGGCDNLSCEFV